MELVPPKPTPSDKKFDRTREEAFSNEGAPPPRLERPLAANADAFGDNEVIAVAPAVPSTSTDAQRLAGELAAKPGEDTALPGGLASDTAGTLRRS